jgi:hypothetical protein
MANTVIINGMDLYEVLKESLGEKQAKSLVGLVEIRVNNKFEQYKTVLATKEDIGDLELKLTKQISDVKVDLLKWQIAMWVTLMIAVLAGKFI